MRNPIMRVGAILVLVSLLVALVGCGKKGALYLPQKDTDKQKTSAPK